MIHEHEFSPSSTNTTSSSQMIQEIQRSYASDRTALLVDTPEPYLSRAISLYSLIDRIEGLKSEVVTSIGFETDISFGRVAEICGLIDQSFHLCESLSKSARQDPELAPEHKYRLVYFAAIEDLCLQEQKKYIEPYLERALSAEGRTTLLETHPAYVQLPVDSFLSPAHTVRSCSSWRSSSSNSNRHSVIENYWRNHGDRFDLSEFVILV